MLATIDSVVWYLDVATLQGREALSRQQWQRLVAAEPDKSLIRKLCEYIDVCVENVPAARGVLSIQFSAAPTITLELADALTRSGIRPTRN